MNGNTLINKEHLRMAHWLGAAIIFYLTAMILASYGTDFYPQVQTVTWKLGHLTVASFFGYRLDLSLFRKRITTDSTDLEHMRRAVMVVGSMIAMAIGM